MDTSSVLSVPVRVRVSTSFFLRTLLQQLFTHACGLDI